MNLSVAVILSEQEANVRHLCPACFKHLKNAPPPGVKVIQFGETYQPCQECPK